MSVALPSATSFSVGAARRGVEQRWATVEVGVPAAPPAQCDNAVARWAERAQRAALRLIEQGVCQAVLRPLLVHRERLFFLVLRIRRRRRSERRGGIERRRRRRHRRVVANLVLLQSRRHRFL